MIFSKTPGIQGNFTNQSLSSQPIFTKVIILDKRNPQSLPQVFSMSPETVINMDDLQALKVHFISGSQEESFIPLGRLASIDRKKKMIKLDNDQLVSYEHLIVATNPGRSAKDDVNAFFVGLATLVDALRMQEQSKTLSVQHLSRSLPPALDKKCTHLTDEKGSISQKVFGEEKNAPDRFYTDIRLYEVQV